MAEQLTIEDYEEVLAEHRQLVRRLDIALNGEKGAARQASLCDIIGQVEEARENIEKRPNHNEAWSVAHFRISFSNLARCYIELRELTRAARMGRLTEDDFLRWDSIVHANDV